MESLVSEKIGQHLGSVPSGEVPPMNHDVDTEYEVLHRLHQDGVINWVQ